jgi:nucleotide-binding universal stress UspA family protein
MPFEYYTALEVAEKHNRFKAQQQKIALRKLLSTIHTDNAVLVLTYVLDAIERLVACEAFSAEENYEYVLIYEWADISAEELDTAIKSLNTLGYSTSIESHSSIVRLKVSWS